MDIFVKVVGFLRILGLQEYQKPNGKTILIIRFFIGYTLLMTLLLQIMWNFTFVADTFASKAETATALISVFSNYVSYVLLMQQRKPLATLFNQIQSTIQKRKCGDKKIL